MKRREPPSESEILRLAALLWRFGIDPVKLLRKRCRLALRGAKKKLDSVELLNRREAERTERGQKARGGANEAHRKSLRIARQRAFAYFMEWATAMLEDAGIPVETLYQPTTFKEWRRHFSTPRARAACKRWGWDVDKWLSEQATLGRKKASHEKGVTKRR